MSYHINSLFFIIMKSTPTISIQAYNGMKCRLVPALKKVDLIKETDRSYAYLIVFIQQNLEKKDYISVVSQEITLVNEMEVQSRLLRDIFIDIMIENRNRYREEILILQISLKYTSCSKIYFVFHEKGV